MKISIVTVSYNSAQTIAQTIESVLHQTYAPYEYIIKDGGSQDATVQIAESYKDAFAGAGIRYLIISGKDAGIYDAMNQGIALASGDLIGLINSDDWYESKALSVVRDAYRKQPFDLFYADLNMHGQNGRTFIKRARYRNYVTSRDWNHPTTFIAREMYAKYSYRNETLHDDYDLILRMLKDHVRVCVVNEVLANFRMNGVSHERDVKQALKRARIKYGIYRQNGYSPFYAVECYGVELAKLIIG